MPDDELVTLRRELHRHPELSGEEAATATRVAAWLQRCNPDTLLRDLGGHGVAAIFGSGKPGPAVLFRCELDGLPIAETGQPAWRSGIPGNAHLCGHDGHMAILAGLARVLAKTPPAEGQVILLFQPAEETGEGARAVIADARFDRIRPDYAFALHNLPRQPLHQIGLRAGPMNFASEGLSFRLTGRTAHASEPENAVSPAAAMTELIDALPGLPDTLEGGGETLVTLVHARLGEEAFGVAPGEAIVMATLRSSDDARQTRLVAAAEALADRVAAAHGLKLSITRSDRFAACVNDTEAVAVAQSACGTIGLASRPLPKPFRWSEDFGAFSNTAKAALFTLGAGETCPPLHAPDYDFPDDLIETGVALFTRIARDLCGSTASR